MVSLTQEEVRATQALLDAHHAVLIAHYYTDANIQAMAEATGGYVADSLDMAKFGADTPHQTLMIAGVHFMGETAKILSPDKVVKVLEPKATCSLDLGCEPTAFAAFRRQYPDHTVVVYANTSAQIKAMADWVVTSSIALEVIRKLQEEGAPILWAPDRFLGQYLQRETGAEMVLWQGECIVHTEFKAEALKALKLQHPLAKTLVHPESPLAVIAEADKVGSTKQLLHYAIQDAATTFIVATEEGIFYQMQKQAPDKKFLLAPTAGHGATCQSCGRCPWMAMNTLASLKTALTSKAYDIHIEPEISAKAHRALTRMVNFKAHG